jgi:hypothetical protein
MLWAFSFFLPLAAFFGFRSGGFQIVCVGDMV